MPQAAQLVAKVAVEGDEDAKRKLSDVSKKVDDTSGGFKGMLKNALSFASGLGIFNLASQAVGFLKDQFVSVIKESMDGQASMAQTEAVIKSTGGAAGMSAQQIADMAGNLSHLTTFSDDTIQSGENMLLTFTNIGKSVFPQATKSLLDLAQAMGGDLKGAAIQEGKALNDPIQGITALSRVGVTFTDQQKAQIKAMQDAGNIAGAQKIILAELNKEFGGSAVAAGKTFGGQLTILQQRLSDVKQVIGDALMPILQGFLGWISSTGMPLLERFGNWFSNTAAPALQGFGDTVSKAWKALDNKGLAALLTSLQGLGTTISQDLSPALKPIGDLFSKAFSSGSVISDAKGLENSFSGMAKGIDSVKNGINAFGNAFKAAMQSQLAKDIFKAFQDMGGYLQATFTPVLQQLESTWKTQLEPSFKQMGTALIGLMPLFQVIGVIVGGVIVVAFGLLVGIITGLVKAFSVLLAGMTMALGGFVQIVTGIVQIFSGLFSAIIDIATGNESKLMSDLGMMWDGIVNIFKGAGSVIIGVLGGLFIGAVSLVSGFIDGIIGFFSHMYDTLVGHSIVPDMVNGIISWFAQLPGRALSAVQSLAGSIGGFFSNLASQALQWGSNIVSGIANGITNAIGKVGDAIGSVTQFISDHLPHSPAKIGPLRDLHLQGSMIADQMSQGMLSGLPKLQSAIGQLVKPIALNLNPTSSSFGSGLGASSYQFPSMQSQNQTQIIVQSPPIYLDGRLLANGLMPHIVNAIRCGVGVWDM